MPGPTGVSELVPTSLSLRRADHNAVVPAGRYVSVAASDVDCNTEGTVGVHIFVRQS